MSMTIALAAVGAAKRPRRLSIGMHEPLDRALAGREVSAALASAALADPQPRRVHQHEPRQQPARQQPYRAHCVEREWCGGRRIEGETPAAAFGAALATRFAEAPEASSRNTAPTLATGQFPTSRASSRAGAVFGAGRDKRSRQRWSTVLLTARPSCFQILGENLKASRRPQLSRPVCG
jgi:hypothetical protein